MDSLTKRIPAGLLDPFLPHLFPVRSDPAYRDLADDVLHNGILKPLLVRPSAHGRFDLIDGQRRLDIVLNASAEPPEPVCVVAPMDDWDAAFLRLRMNLDAGVRPNAELTDRLGAINRLASLLQSRIPNPSEWIQKSGLLLPDEWRRSQKIKNLDPGFYPLLYDDTISLHSAATLHRIPPDYQKMLLRTCLASSRIPRCSDIQALYQWILQNPLSSPETFVSALDLFLTRHYSFHPVSTGYKGASYHPITGVRIRKPGSGSGAAQADPPLSVSAEFPDPEAPDTDLPLTESEEPARVPPDPRDAPNREPRSPVSAAESAPMPFEPADPAVPDGDPAGSPPDGSGEDGAAPAPVEETFSLSSLQEPETGDPFPEPAPRVRFTVPLEDDSPSPDGNSGEEDPAAEDNSDPFPDDLFRFIPREPVPSESPAAVPDGSETPSDYILNFLYNS